MYGISIWARLRRRCWRMKVVAGLDVGPDGISWVVLSGSQTRVTAVLCAESLKPPATCVGHGHISDPIEFGRWLRHLARDRDLGVDALVAGVNDVLITHHQITLPALLTPEDVMFQLTAEVNATRTHDADVQIDFAVAPSSEPADVLVYQVYAVPRAHVAHAWEVARGAQFNLQCLMSRAAAASQAEKTARWVQPSRQLQEAPLQYPIAFGLAIAAWMTPAFNFLPHRDWAAKKARQAWWIRVLVCFVSGLGFAYVCLGMVSVAMDHRSAQTTTSDMAALIRAHDAAKQEHVQLALAQQRALGHRQWLLQRQHLQESTLAWSRRLSDASQGVWVAQVRQQGLHWTVQGEALSSDHAQQFAARLSALTIWAQPPQLPVLKLQRVGSGRGSSVWTFLMEADLKEGSR